MTETKPNRLWAIVVIILISVVIVGVIVAWSRYRPGKPVEIVLAPDKEISGNIFIDGAVVNPGIYPFDSGDTIGALVKSAGGVTADGPADNLNLYVPSSDTQEAVQKIDINRAETWLLESLPGVGPAKAQAIVDYRNQNGPFKNVSELTKVDGIGPSLYEQIKDLVTVSG
ncbi:MAG: ComEA family DNA-binding protein [Dehalococcoidales bacterium]|nr:ComEA family DNA-binding protein [Dehalococcoidales bacterium]